MSSKTILICVVTMVIAGCSGKLKDSESTSEIRKLLDAYIVDDDEHRELARDRVMDLGDKAVPVLEELLRTEDDFAIRQSALRALVDLGSEASFSALLAALGGKTRVERGHAAAMVSIFVAMHDWSAEQVRAVPNANRSIRNYVKSEDLPIRLSIFATAVGAHEAIPRLRSLAEGDDLDDALRAARAIYAISGERVDVKRHDSRFVGRKLNEGLLVRRWTKTLNDRFGPFCLTRSTSGEPRIVIASGDITEWMARLRLVDCSQGTVSDLVAMKGALGPILCIPESSGNDGTWLFSVYKKDRWVRSSIIIAFDAHGKETWRIAPPGREFLSLARLPRADRQPLEVVLSYAGGQDGFLAVGVEGETLWNRTTLVYTQDLKSHACLPGFFLGQFQGSIRLFSRDGVQIGEWRSKTAYASDVALVQAKDGSVAVAALLKVRTPPEYQLSLLDSRMTVKWTCRLPEPARQLGVIDTGCDGDSLIVVLGAAGTLFAVDLDGVLLWSGRAFALDPLQFDAPRIGTLSATDSHPAIVFTVCDKEMALWEWNPTGNP